MSQCEDFPCCGHTDGLGCDWVSPNEIVPCNTCLNARASYPYHSAMAECPTERKLAQDLVPKGVSCSYYGVEDDCDGKFADIGYGNQFLCFNCYQSVLEYDRQMQEQYDDIWR